MKKHEQEIELHIYPRETETITLEIPKDALESLKKVAVMRDMSEKALLKFYISQGLRHDLSKTIPTFTNYADMAKFWDTHDSGDYWEQTEPAEFEIAPHARRQYLVAVDRTLLGKIQQLAWKRDVTTESLVNVLLEQRLQELTAA